MAVHIVTGPVSVGKQLYAQRTKKIMEKLGKNVYVASISDIMNQYKRRYRTESQPMKETVHRAISEGLLEKMAINIQGKLIEMQKKGSRYDEVILTLPLTIMNHHGAIEHLPSLDSIRKILEILDYSFGHSSGHMVCLIDDPRRILSVMDTKGDHNYAGSVLQLLEWTSMEVAHTEQIAEAVAGGRWLAVPIDRSETTLAKLMIDLEKKVEPSVAYIAHPISEIIKMEKSPDLTTKNLGSECFRKIHDFKNELQNYRIVISPIELMKEKTVLEQDSIMKRIIQQAVVSSVNEEPHIREKVLDILNQALKSTVSGMLREHTVFRDLYWFVRMGGLIAYYPHPMDSPGAQAEIIEAIQLGKPVTMVKDEVKNDVQGVTQVAEKIAMQGTDGAKSSPFAFEKDLKKEDVFSSPGEFFEKQERKYEQVEKAFEEVREEEKKMAKR